MRTYRRLARIALIFALAGAATGCGGAGASPNPVPAQPSTKQFVYVSVGTQQPLVLAGFFADSVTGQTQPMSPLVVFADGAGGGEGTSIAADPKGQFLFATTDTYMVGSTDATIQVGANQLFMFRIDPITGGLSVAPGFPMQLPSAAPVYASPDGRFVYVLTTLAGKSAIGTYALDRAGATITQVLGSPLLFDLNVDSGWGTLNSLAISPDGKFMYAAQGVTPLEPPFLPPIHTNIYTLALDQDTGLPSVSSAISLPFVFPYGASFTFTPDRQYLYFGAGAGYVSALLINTDGSLAALGTTPIGDGGVAQVLAHPTGKFLLAMPAFFAGDGSYCQTYVYSIGQSGTLTPVTGSPFTTFNFGGGVVVDPTGRFLYMPATQNLTNLVLATYRIDPLTGTLSPLPEPPQNLTCTGMVRSVLITPAQ